MKILETARLALRTVEAADAPFYLEVVNDPGFIANIGDRGIRTLEAARLHIENGPVKMQETLGHAIWLVALKDSGVAIGMCGLIKRETLPEVDIGYAFLPAWRGQGYALEAAEGALAYARDTLGMARLLAITSPHNTASSALLEKLGLRFEKIVHLTPEDPGTRLYTMELCATA
ncbi:GNAT family N-acetyltransferase [Massilia sp. CCM 9210]|uniref:GNAT family N-acetyltransferase n=1 Tax=Massilia scottii TaxID=3057166 RepID=UPI002796B02B|nr:GNAT family N-acetyltransferase [Massilia sp. CCM 9210]MDQ1813966.1 GNAT family N-acetyltransferase [Massilia sp. CCM 9210]